MPFDFRLHGSPVPHYRSRLLDSFGVRHAFFTRRGGVSRGVFESLNFAVGIGSVKDDIKNGKGGKSHDKDSFTPFFILRERRS